MKILLSAYACEPDKGSEPGLGWSWALELASLGNEVWVVTRANNRKALESVKLEEHVSRKLRFVYVDLPYNLRRLKRLRGGIYPYYLLWQWKALEAAREIHETEKFEVVQHVTFVSARQPSFMGRLGVPFIFGPVGGGEAAPYPLRKEYGFSGWIKDFLRDAANAFARIDPLMRYTYKTSARIFVTSEQTKRMIPERFQDKTTIRLAIGLDRPVVEATHRYPSPGNLLKILYVGRFLYWKGMTLGIKSFARLIRSGISAELTFVGQGPETSRMKTLAAHLGISKKIRWISWVERKNLKDLYKAHDLFLFPSFHDSGGMVVLEAMSHGLPVVCLDLGGPGVMVDETCGIKIPVSGKNSREVVQSLCSAMVAINRDKLLFSDLSRGAGERARSFALKETIAQFNADILEAICRR